MLPAPVFLSFARGSAGKESTCNAGDLGLIPGLGRSPGEGKGYPLQYSGLENSMDCVVHGVAESQTLVSDFDFHFVPVIPRVYMAGLTRVRCRVPHSGIGSWSQPVRHAFFSDCGWFCISFYFCFSHIDKCHYN